MNIIVDTNVLIDGIDLNNYNKVYVPIVVVEELDHLKTNKNIELAISAKNAIKQLKNATNVEVRFSCSASFASKLDMTLVDNQILAYAKDATTMDNDCVLVSADHNVVLKAKHLEIPCEYYDFEKVCGRNDDYCGFKEVVMTQYEQAVFYECKANKWDIVENQYLIIRDEDGSIVDKFRWTSDRGFVNLYKKTFDSIAIGKFKPKDIYQECVIDSLVTSDFTIITGPAGSAKTLSSLAYIMQELQTGKRDCCKIVFSTAPLKGNKELGFLPGSRNEKLLGGSLGGILSSKLGSMLAVEQMISQGKLVLIPTSEIRGIEIGENDILFVTEAQNTDIYTMKTTLQRAKDGCKIIVEGDVEEQVDMNHCQGRQNGMLRAIDVFKGEKEFSCVRLQNIYRGKVANIAQKM